VRRADRLDCEAVADLLPRLADGATRADRAVVRHVGQCLRCQAELAKYRRLLRLLHQLREQRPSLPPGALESLLANVEARAGAQAARSALGGRRLVAAVAVLVVTATAGTAAVLAGTVWARRRSEVPVRPAEGRWPIPRGAGAAVGRHRVTGAVAGR
jgi:predicted anti-sigma-YlaC factor YlaD